MTAKSGKTRKSTPRELLKEKLKEEVARELGLLEEVKAKGWGGLTSRQTGRIGGIISRKKRKQGG